MISLRCENCGATVQARSGVSDYACTYCGHRFVVPSMDSRGISPFQRKQAIWRVVIALSILEFTGADLAALIVYPKWEADVLLWISFIGVPGTLTGIVLALYRFFIRRPL